MSIQQLMLGVGASKKTYMDDVFSTYAYKGNSTDGRAISTGVDMTEGGLVWTKIRDANSYHVLHDTVNTGKFLQSQNSDSLITSTTTVTGFSSTGYTLGTDSAVNSSNNPYASWSFRKAKGFFDVVTWTGNETARTINHNLGSIPGMILVKCTSSSRDWTVWHRDTSDPTTKFLVLNSSAGEAATGSAGTQNDMWNSSAPTATNFPIGVSWDVNRNNETYVAYLFAGGESTAATARSIKLDGTNDGIKTSTSTDYDFGTGDFTVEFWIKFNDVTTTQQTADHRTSTNGSAWCNYIDSSRRYKFWYSDDQILSKQLDNNQWYHIANVRHSGTTTLYVDGVSQGTYADTNDYSNQRLIFGLHGPDESSYDVDGEYSNIRIVKGTAVYTSSFKPPTAPLTDITNTKFLGANNSSVTGTTVGTAVALGDPTASTDSPFDDPAAFTFGDSKEGIVKCGSYVGNGSSTGPEINLGWEPQWILFKNTGHSEHWTQFDAIRGIVTGGNDSYFRMNMNSAEADADLIDLTPTGFKLVSADGKVNQDTKKFVYLAIRRSDGYVGKPVETATDVFAMDTGNSSSTIPAMDSNFPVDWAMVTQPGSASDWWSYARLMQNTYMVINGSGTEGYSSAGTFDSNVGFYEGSGYNSNYQSWMWKRHAGFDVVTYTGTSVGPRSIPHSLAKIPEMIVVKRRNNSEDWTVYHSGIGSPAINYHIQWNTNAARTDGSGFSHYVWGGVAPTSTHFSVGGSSNPDRTNNSNSDYIALLFASVDGISKVGSYTGSTSTITVTTGFQPRFVLIKRAEGISQWSVFDTTRGWGSGNDQLIEISNDEAQANNYDAGAPTSTGFTINTGQSAINSDGEKYIYYAHA